MTVDLEQATSLIELALERARAANSDIAVTILDERGLVVATVRMDRAIPATVPGSHSKARTAWLFACPTEQLSKFGTGIASVTDEPTNTFAGGRPLSVGERVVGAVGIAGGTEPTDARIAQRLSESFNRGQTPPGDPKND